MKGILHGIPYPGGAPGHAAPGGAGERGYRRRHGR